MTVFTWTPGATGDWFTATDWSPSGPPGVSDAAIINTGTPQLASGSSISGVSIVLGGLSTGQPVTLQATGTTFKSGTIGSGSNQTTYDAVLTVTGGNPSSSPLNATFLAQGNVSYDGQIYVKAMGGGLTIDSEGNFTLNNADDKALILVGQESLLTVTGQTVTDDGFIQVLGGLDVASGAILTTDLTSSGTPEGLVALEDGGQMTIRGRVTNALPIDFADGTGSVTLFTSGSGPFTFGGVFGFVSTVSGNTIDLPNIVAQSAQYSTAGAGQPGRLTLYNQGNLVATLPVQFVDDESLGGLGGAGLSASDFTLSNDGSGGTLVTYTPPNGIQLEQALPVPIVASKGQFVSLASILQSAFGTSSPGFTQIKLVQSKPFTNQPGKDIGYWGSPDPTQADCLTPTWYTGNGTPITPAANGAVVTDINQVWLRVGNQIDQPALFQAVVTQALTGPQSETITYNCWSVDPSVVNLVPGFGSAPTPDSILASAHAFDTIYPGIPNDNLCNWIGDNVAAAADAPMPPDNFLLDPTLNVSGGFWRIFYRGSSGGPNNWSTLVKPGDIVRMGWLHPTPGDGPESGHTTTVLGAVGSNGEITVFDNDDPQTGPNGNFTIIGKHTAAYWNGTDPADITIYRLDANQQYLILGTSLSEVIQGSVFNDLIQPGGGADRITGGPGNNEIQDTTAHLNSITVTDFNAGDTLDFTDLDPTRAQLSFANGFLTASDGAHLARLALLGLTNPTFVATPDGNGGTLVALGGGNGDVHMVCFDGLNYDFQAVGDFVAVQSTDGGNPWQIQIRTDSFPGATSITTALAATFGSDRISFAVGRANTVYVDGAPDTTLQVGTTQSFAGGTLSELSAGVYQLAWNTGQRVTVTNQGDWLDWTVALGPHDGPGSVRGLLGSNSGRATDFQLPDGTVLAHPSAGDILGVFADAWRVAPGTSLLDQPIAPAAAAFGQAMAGQFAPSAIATQDPGAPLSEEHAHTLLAIPA